VILVVDAFGGMFPPIVMDFIVPSVVVGAIAVFLLYKFCQRFGLIDW
jgi:hypothetical protein